MGVATATAIGISAATAGASFAAASKQRKLQREAMAAADKAMAEAKSKLNVNYFDALSVNKEPYELQREALLSQGAQAIEAAKEADRGAVEAAGRVQMAENQAQADIRASMSKDMSDISKLQAGEDARLAGLQANIGLKEAMGAQQAAADASAAANKYIESGLSSLGDIGTEALAGSELYRSNRSENKTNQSENKTNQSKNKTNQSKNQYGMIGPIEDDYLNPFEVNGFAINNKKNN